ncbi:MAG: tRNA 2-thiocytidine(32) synthetase TtcA [Myxococcales bacterium]|nr:tRNA 2-thiocytidine(32) synthetase TtcA [Myxococcales bacterium]MCB9691798.1 tRNA 2-thiocytidine(32) synthetase TtcA [Alphaproteobacteria bacterium]
MQVTRVNKKLLAAAAKASQDFGLVEPGDRILVALSGGKDSYALMVLLEQMRRKAPFDFELVGVNLDQGHPGFQQHVIVEWCEANGFAHHMLHRDTYTVVKEKTPEGKAYCSMCSRLRRGILYDAAQDLGCTKIALGHHRDDVVETLLLNLFYSGQLKAMPPRLVSDDARNVVIRPLVYCDEADIVTFAEEQAFPVLPCTLCGTQEGLQRVAIKRLLGDLHARNPKVKGNVFAALANVKPSHLYDRALWDFAGLPQVDSESIL